MRKKEQQLIDDYLKGDKKSLEILIRQHYGTNNPIKTENALTFLALLL